VSVNVPAADAASAVQQFVIGIGRIESWMGGNRLRLIADKTQVICVGTRQQFDKLEISEVQLSTTKSSLLTH
jgi:hypothetical protein